ncbi:MAG: PGPGW domain-containing protein, partial [Actinomycetota bacterium]|nr:PGPGW domain-containing protein [Actinomycetota bacterium]
MASPPTPHREQEQPEPEEDKPELLVKLQERKERHSERGLPARIGVVVLGVVLVLAGILLSGPGVPGPGFLVILIGLSFLALEFDRAERLLEKAIVAADRA